MTIDPIGMSAGAEVKTLLNQQNDFKHDPIWVEQSMHGRVFYGDQMTKFRNIFNYFPKLHRYFSEIA